MFITAVCVLFLIKLRCPKKKSIYVQLYLVTDVLPKAVWPSSACTCVDLCSLWSRSNLNASWCKFLKFGHPVQINRSWMTSICWVRENALQCIKMDFLATCLYLRGNLRVSTQVQLVGTCGCLQVCLGRTLSMVIYLFIWNPACLMELPTSLRMVRPLCIWVEMERMSTYQPLNFMSSPHLR